jgi:hypothetical protein
MLPPLAVVPCDAVEEGLQEVRAAWSSRAGPRSTHCDDERRSSVLSAWTAVSSGRTAAPALRFAARLQGGCVYRLEQQAEGVWVTLSRNDGAATGLDLEMRKMTVAATLGVPAGSAEGNGGLGCARGHLISGGHLHHHFRLPQPQYSSAHRSGGPNWARP